MHTIRFIVRGSNSSVRLWLLTWAIAAIPAGAVGRRPND